MSGLIQNSHTSLLPIYSANISPGGTAIVYLSTTTNVGQLITVRDMDGFLSSPQQILVSTTPGVSLNGSTTPISLRQRFAYLTLRATAPAAWTTIDTSAFADPTADYSIRGIAYSSFQIQDLVILSDGVVATGNISTNQITFNSLDVDSQVATSTLGISSLAPTTVANFQGPVYASTVSVLQPLSIGGTLTTGGTIALSTNISSLANTILSGSATASTITVGGEVSSANPVSIGLTASVGGTATLTALRTTRNLAASTLVSPIVATTNAVVSSLQLSTTGSFRPRDDIPIVDASYTGPTNPVVFTDLGNATARLLTSNIAAAQLTVSSAIVLGQISTGGAATLQFGVAQILNSNGAVVVSSATVGTATLSNTVVAPGGGPLQQVSCGPATASTVTSQFQTLAGSMIAPTAYTTLLNANTITTSTLSLGLAPIQGNTLTVSTLLVSTAISTAELSSIVCPVAQILNTNGLSRTSTLSVSSATATTLQGVQQITSVTGLTFGFSAPAVSFSTAQASTANVATVATTSSLRAVAIALGTALNYSTLGPTDPWISTSTVSGLTSNTEYEYIQSTSVGTPYQPLRIHATSDRTVNLYLRNVSSFSTNYFTANMTYRNDSSISGVAGLRIVNAGGTSTIISFNANPVVGFQKQTLSNYAIDLNTAPSTLNYWFDGPNTLSSPSTFAAYQPLLAGGQGVSYLALNFAGDTGTWASITSIPFTTATNALAWNGSNLWLAGGEGTNHLAYSADGSNWFSTNTGLFTTIRALAWNGTYWVAGGSGANTLAYSADGFNWTGLGTAIFSTRASAVAWSGNLWVAGGAGTNSLAYSYDGIAWTGLGLSTFTGEAYGLTWGASTNVWVAAGGPSSVQLAYSYNGKQWFQPNISTFVDATSYGYCVGWNGSQFVAGGDSNILYSVNGTSWTKVGVSSIMSTVRAVSWTGNQWCIGGTYTTHALATSSNAAAWTGITASTLFTRANAVASRQPIPLDLSGSDYLLAGEKTISFAQVPNTWTATTAQFSTISALAIAPTAVVAAGRGQPADPSGAFLVGVMSSGRIYYSTDSGANWTLAASLTQVYSVAFSGSLWVAVSDGATPVYYSSDGISWTAAATIPSATYFSLNSVAYGNGRWIATGNVSPASSRVITSTDGINWSNLSGASSLIILGTGVLYANGMWILISSGASGAPNAVIYSYDGLNWFQSASGSANYTNLPEDIAWNGSRFMITGNTLNSLTIASSDGISWTAVTGANTIMATYSGYGYSIATNGKTWVIAFRKSSGPNAGGLMYSLDDGNTWTEVSGIGTLIEAVNEVRWNGFYFVGVGYVNAQLYNIVRSSDGVNWSGAGLISGQAFNSLACRVPIPVLKSQTILTSLTRGNTWVVTDQTTIFTHARGVAWNGYLWVAVGDANTDAIAYSLDGLTWRGVTGTSLATSFTVVAWNGTTWFVYGSGTNTIATSTDGVSWTGQGAGLAPTTCAAYNGSNLWVGGSTGANTLLTSANGISWTGQGNTTFNTIVRAVAWNGSKWTAVGGAAAALATSVNGTTWTTAGAPTLDTASGVVWTSRQWVAVGTSTIATASAAATSWSTFTVSSLSTNTVLASANLLPYGTADSNLMFAGSSNATNRFAITTTGTSWIPISSVTAAVNTVSWNGRFWTFGLGSAPALQIMASNFVLSTPTQTSFNLTTTKGIAWGSQLGLAVGTGSAAQNLAYTTDGGLSWSANRNNLTPYFFFDTTANAVAFGSNMWVAVGQEATLTQSKGIRYSRNGVNWSTPSTTAGRGILLGCAIAYHSSIWVVGGSTITGTNDTLAVSADGATWNYLSNTTFSVAARGIAWGSNKFVAVGEGTNSIAYSADGSNWTGLGTSVFTTRGRAVAWNGKYFVAQGEGLNTLAYSADGITWTGQGTTTFNAMGGGGIASKALLPTVEAAPTPTPISAPAKTFIWSLAAMTELSQTSVQKPAAGGSAWNARAASAQGFTASTWLSFQPAQTTAEIMFGLSENPTSTLSYTALNFAFYMTSGGNLRIYELGTQIAIVGAYTTADILRITYDGTTVRYYQNTTLLRSVSRAVGAALYMSSSFYTPSGIIQSIDFHPLYTLTTSKPPLSTTGYAVSQTAGTNVDQFGPFYLTLTSSLLPSLWNFYVNLTGTATSTNSLYADIFINETKYFSTTIVAPIYSTLSTYTLSFSNTTAVQISTPALLDVRIRATRAAGDTYLYTNWTDGISAQRSSAAILNSYNPNAIEYLQFYHTTFGSGLQTSELDIYVSPTSTVSTYLNSNVGIEVYSGFLRWSSSVNATVIENRYNDTQTRSLTYSGALYNASDPRLKEDIVAADTAALYQTLANLPLRRYTFNASYLETYRPDDTTQLGVLTTEVAPLLPDVVKPGPKGFDTIDRVQLRFAHLAATQALIERVAALRAKLERCAGLRHISTPQ